MVGQRPAQVGWGSFETIADGILSYLSVQRTNLVPTFALVDDPFGAKGLPMGLLRRLLAFERRALFVCSPSTRLTGSLRLGRVDDRLTVLFGIDLSSGRMRGA